MDIKPGAALAAALVALSVAGCDHQAISSSLDRYYECLTVNASAPERCEEARRAHEAELYTIRVPRDARRRR